MENLKTNYLQVFPASYLFFRSAHCPFILGRHDVLEFRVLCNEMVLALKSVGCNLLPSVHAVLKPLLVRL